MDPRQAASVVVLWSYPVDMALAVSAAVISDEAGDGARSTSRSHRQLRGWMLSNDRRILVRGPMRTSLA